MAIVSFPSPLTAPSALRPRTYPLPALSRVFPISGAAFALVTLPYTVTTLASVVARVRERLIASFWTDDELTLYVQEGLRIWNTLTGYYRERVDITFTASQSQYAVPILIEDGMVILRIETDSVHLDPIALDEIGTFIPGYQSTAAGVPMQWIPIGMNIIVLYPQALSAFVTHVDYIRQAPIPVSSTDFIQIGEEDLTALIDYATWVARLKEGGKELQDAMPLLQSFLTQAAKYNSRLLTSAIYRKLLGLPAGGNRPERPVANEYYPARK